MEILKDNERTIFIFLISNHSNNYEWCCKD